MSNPRYLAALAGALVLVCAAAALEWYFHAGRAPAPFAAPAQATPSAARSVASPLVTSGASKPVVYVVAQASGGPAGAATSTPHGNGTATIAAPTSVPLAGTATSIPQMPAQARAAIYVAPPPPILKSPNAAPEIVSMSVSTPIVHSGELISANVETSTNVASVEARIGGYSSSLRKVGAGRFALSYRVPYLPFFLKKTYAVELIARNTRGDATSTTFPITVK